MARYIDLDKLLKDLEDELKDKNPNDIAYLVFKLFIGRLNHEPTADVERGENGIDHCPLCGSYIINAEGMERLRMAQHCDPVGEPGVMGEPGVPATIFEIENAKTEVAREIFDEIEREIKNHGITYAQRKIAELKKKYTEVDNG